MPKQRVMARKLSKYEQMKFDYEQKQLAKEKSGMIDNPGDSRMESEKGSLIQSQSQGQNRSFQEQNSEIHQQHANHQPNPAPQNHPMNNTGFAQQNQGMAQDFGRHPQPRQSEDFRPRRTFEQFTFNERGDERPMR
jgi:hypothetical protein